MSYVAVGQDAENVISNLSDYGVENLEEIAPGDIHQNSKVFVNGKWGWLNNVTQLNWYTHSEAFVGVTGTRMLSSTLKLVSFVT